MLTSGNRTPGSRSYSDLLDTSADSICIHQLIFKRRSKSQAARIIVGGNAIDQVRASHGGQNEDIIMALTTLPQGWVSAHKHQCKTVISTMWTESSWAFPKSYTGDDSWIMRSRDGGQRGNKSAHNSTTNVSFCTIIIRLCHCMIAITTV